MAVKRWMVACCGAALVLGACSSDDDAGSTTSVSGTTNPTGTTSADAPATTTSTDDSADVTSTVVPITSETDPDETLPPDSTTTTTAVPTFEDKLVQELVEKGLEALPEGWTGVLTDDLGNETDTGFGKLLGECAGDDAYDLGARDADSAAAWELNAEGPAAGDSSPVAALTIEARKFARSSTAESAFQTLTTALTSDDAKQCVADRVPNIIAGAAPPGSTFTATVRESTVQGAGVTMGLDVTLTSGGATALLYVDIAASDLGDGVIVFASFTSTFVPLDGELASSVYQAIVAA